MKTLLKLRRLTRKRAYLSHKREWYIVDFLMLTFVVSLIQFLTYTILYGIKPW